MPCKFMRRTRPNAEDLTPEEFKAIRESLGLTPQQFALEMGLYGEDVADWVLRFESGEENMPLTVPQLALNVADEHGVLDQVLKKTRRNVRRK